MTVAIIIASNHKGSGNEKAIEDQIDSLNNAIDNQNQQIEVLNRVVIKERKLVELSNHRLDSMKERENKIYIFYEKERYNSRAIADTAYTSYFTGVVRSH